MYYLGKKMNNKIEFSNLKKKERKKEKKKKKAMFKNEMSHMHV